MSIALSIFLLLTTVVAVSLFLRQRTQLIRHKKKISELELQLTSATADAAATRAQAISQDEFVRLSSHVVSRMDQGILCIDQKGMVRLANPYAEKLLGGTPLVGKPYTEVLHSLKIAGTTDFSAFEAAIGGNGFTLPDNIELATGHGNIPLSATLVPLFSDLSGTFTLFTFADNSRNVAGIAEEKAFFSAAAHELRTPLTVIRLAVSILLSKIDTFDKAALLDHLNKINISSEQLLNLINDLLNVSRIDQGRLIVEKTPFDIISLTDEVVKELTDLANTRRLYIHHDPSTNEYRTVIGDKTKAKEVLTNLISNGIKYTIQGGITITHEQNGGSLVTVVSDTGSGIPAGSKSLLFKRFLQVGEARQQSSAKGSGLGLYISKKFAQLMGGDVKLESSEPGKGSTFAFRLPLG